MAPAAMIGCVGVCAPGRGSRVRATVTLGRSLDAGPTVEKTAVPLAGLRRIAAPIQLATASLVVVLGIVLTGQALTQVL